jgi:catalase
VSALDPLCDAACGAEGERGNRLIGLVLAGQDKLGRYDKHRDDDDFVQPRALYRDVMSDTDREHLVTNIVSHVRAGVQPEMAPRVIEYWSNVHPELGAQVAKQLNGG